MSMMPELDMERLAGINQLIDFVGSALWAVLVMCFVLLPLLTGLAWYLATKQEQVERRIGRQGEIDFIQEFAVKLERIELALEIMLLDDAHSQKGELEKLLTYVVNAKLTNAARLTTLLDEDCEPQPELAIRERDSVMAKVKTIIPELSPSF